MQDILSDLCNLPTGVFRLEFLPHTEIAGWNGKQPTPTIRWYGMAAYQDSISYQQITEDTDHGHLTQVNIGCLIVSDSQAVADQLEAMEQMYFVVRLTHHDLKTRIIGCPGQYCSLQSTDYTPTEMVGAQGYKIQFQGSFSKKPAVISAG